MHEWQVQDDGRTVLAMLRRMTKVTDPKLNFTVNLIDCGFVEFDLQANQTVFEWWSSEHIAMSESTLEVPTDGHAWNYLSVVVLDHHSFAHAD